jgi:16S rRNA (uracil1498-N3)-methyltransferase
MPSQRFYLKDGLQNELLVLKDRSLVHQMKNVLKFHKGEQVIFFNDLKHYVGFDYVFELKSIERGSVALMFREKVENRRESSKKLILFQSLLKKDRFEEVLRHGTEIGIREFVPVLAARSEKKSLNRQRAETVLKEAAEQSGRAIVPKLHDVLTFEQAFMMAESTGNKVYFTSIDEKDNVIYPSGERALNLFVGPEGGWDEKEVLKARSRNCEIISLGRLTLRAETAAIAASYTLLWV